MTETVTHPSVLHTAASAWSLRDSWHMAQAAYRAACAAGNADDRGVLQAWRPSPGRSGSGGYSDAIGAIIIAGDAFSPAGHYRRLAQTAHDEMAQARWLVASELGVEVGQMATVPRFIAALSGLRPGSAREVQRWLDEADRRIRRGLEVGPAVADLPGGLDCPSCAVRMLRVHTAVPVEQRTAYCGAGCRCRGDSCPCGMAVRARGVPHIWELALLREPSR